MFGKSNGVKSNKPERVYALKQHIQSLPRKYWFNPFFPRNKNNEYNLRRNPLWKCTYILILLWDFSRFYAYFLFLSFQGCPQHIVLIITFSGKAGQTSWTPWVHSPPVSRQVAPQPQQIQRPQPRQQQQRRHHSSCRSSWILPPERRTRIPKRGQGNSAQAQLTRTQQLLHLLGIGRKLRQRWRWREVQAPAPRESLSQLSRQSWPEELSFPVETRPQRRRWSGWPASSSPGRRWWRPLQPPCPPRQAICTSFRSSSSSSSWAKQVPRGSAGFQRKCSLRQYRGNRPPGGQEHPSYRRQSHQFRWGAEQQEQEFSIRRVRVRAGSNPGFAKVRREKARIESEKSRSELIGIITPI